MACAFGEGYKLLSSLCILCLLSLSYILFSPPFSTSTTLFPYGSKGQNSFAAIQNQVTLTVLASMQEENILD
jgi:hypothetical protein